MLSTYVFFHLLQYQMDPAQERALAFEMSRRQMVKQEAKGPDLGVIKQKLVAERFNRLVDAVEEFSKAYNGAKGQTWPADKAKALQKAIKELQDVEPSFRASNKH
jgi:hypothetical protein